MASATSIPLHALTLQNLTLDDVAKIFTIIALILGGIGAYYKFIKGRVYTVRLEPRVTCQIFLEQNGYDLIVSSSLKNVGLSRVKIQQRGTGLRLLSGDRENAGTIVHSVTWKPLATFPVFKDHEHLGANESIEDRQLFAIPQHGTQQDFRLELWVASEGAVWKAVSIVTKGKNSLTESLS